MNNFELERMLNETGCARGSSGNRFKVIASDELEIDKPLPAGHLRITNLDLSTGAGWHWVLFYSAPPLQDGSTLIYYFDSLGQCPETYGNIKAFLKQYNCMQSNENFNVQFKTEL